MANIFEDTFEIGSYAVGWESTEGSVDTWANHGVSAPSGGGNYGAELTSQHECLYAWSSGATVWMECRVYSGDCLSDNNWVCWMKEGGNSIIVTRFYNSGGAVLRIFNDITSVGYNVTGLSENTWYKVKIQLVRHASAGIIKVWVDDSLEIDESGLDTGDVNPDKVHMHVADGNTTYFDYFFINDADIESDININVIEVE